MLLERAVIVGESIRLSPVWPRSESRSDAIQLSLFFSGSRPCFYFVSPGAAAFPFA